MKRVPRRTITVEFKAEAIDLVIEQNLTHKEASRKPDIATKSLCSGSKQQARGTLEVSLEGDKLNESQRHLLGQRADGEFLLHAKKRGLASFLFYDV